MLLNRCLTTIINPPHTQGKLSPFSLADATRTLLFLHHIRGGSFASYASSTSPALLSLSSRQRCHTRGTRSIMGGLLSKGVEYEADGVTVKNCLFCDIAASKPGLRQTAVAFEDDKVRFGCVNGSYEPSSFLTLFSFPPPPSLPPSFRRPVGSSVCPLGAMRIGALAGRASGSPA